MKITNEFTVHTPIDRAWEVLTDLEGIAPCMPGAQLTGVEGDTYKGKVKVKVGPVISDFAGTARFTEKDETAHRAVIDAKGRDARSAGNASALVTAVLTPNGSSTAVSVDTDLKISGKLAQFGSGMIKEVSGKLLAQFVANLEAKLATEDATPPAATAAPTAAPTAATPAPASAPAAAPASDSAASTAPAAPSDAAPAAAPASASPTAGGLVSLESTGDEFNAVCALPASTGSGGSPASSKKGDAEESSTAEPEPLDLLSVAGGSIYKRLIPVGVVAIVVVAVIIWLIAR